MRNILETIRAQLFDISDKHEFRGPNPDLIFKIKCDKHIMELVDYQIKAEATESGVVINSEDIKTKDLIGTSLILPFVGRLHFVVESGRVGYEIEKPVSTKEYKA